jgi:ribosomal protein S18 acetylase RimI-like enzyme
MSLFAEYLPKDQVAAPLDVCNGLMIRTVEARDLAALALIAAEREGSTQTVQLKLLEKHLSHQETGQSLILVAEVPGAIAGFGKCAYCKPPDSAPANAAPAGWYLTGVIVAPQFRRRRIGHQLTQARLQWLARRTSKAYYVASAQNRVTIELHRQFGFVEGTRDFSFPNVSFTGGVGILFEMDLRSPHAKPIYESEIEVQAGH